MYFSKTLNAMVFSILFITTISCVRPGDEKSDFPTLKGPYLGQKPPGKTAEIFAPGIISTERTQHSYAAFSKDGKDFFWSETYDGSNGNIVLHSRELNGRWTKPVIFEETKAYNEGVPFFSRDSTKLYVHSDRSGPKWDKEDFNIWYFEKEGEEWKGPEVLSFFPNTIENWEFFGCQIGDGSFYFTSNNFNTNVNRLPFGLVKVPFVDGEYIERLPLGEQFNDGNLNWTPYVDPDESYIIFSSNRDNPEAGFDGCDLFISFKKETGEWTDPINMGSEINTKETIERFPIVSPDGKYLFFIRDSPGDFYWVDASIIEELRPKN